MQEVLDYLFLENAVSIVLLICFMFYLHFNTIFPNKISSRFKMLAVIYVVLTIFVIVDYYILKGEESEATSTVVYILSIVYHLLTLFVPIIFFEILKRNHNSKYSALYYIIPIVVVAVIEIVNACVPSHFLYEIKFGEEDNYINKPWLAIEYTINCLYYLSLVVHVITNTKTHFEESATIIGILGITIISYILEYYYSLMFITNCFGIICMVFYYLTMQILYYNTDEVTGAFARRNFFVKMSKSKKHDFALVSIDIDNLKEINDTQGHQAGDVALKKVVDVVDKYCPKNCFTYRMGGDEFSLICVGYQGREMSNVMANVVEALSKDNICISYGIVDNDVDKAENEIMAEADKLLYAMKNTHKNKVESENL